MQFQEGLLLKSDEWISPNLLIELAEFLKREHIELYIFDPEMDCLMKCQQLILERGTSHILSLQTLQEDILPKVDIPHRYLLMRIIRDKLVELSPSSSLIIVDPYLFPDLQGEKRASYVQTIEDVLEPIVFNIKDIKFITLPLENSQLLNEVRERLLNINPQLVISHKFSKDFHDRYWITDERKGLFIGTSLNGIGNKYALVDNIKDEDTQEIIDILRNLGLLNT